MKYIGSSTTSKNTKNRIRSWAMNVPGHADLQHEHQDEERLRRCPASGMLFQRVDHHEERDDHRQEVQRQADAVEPDRVVRLDHLDPARSTEELQLLGWP